MENSKLRELKFYAITKVFGKGGTIVTNEDESKYQAIQPNRIVVRFNIKL